MCRGSSTKKVDLVDDLDPTLLRLAVEQEYGCRARSHGAVPVAHPRDGRQSMVHIFDLDGCAAATVAYVWWAGAEARPGRVMTVLGVPPVNTALDAVRRLAGASR